MSKANTPALRHERLTELLDYDPATGLFRWLVARAWHTPAGKVAGGLRKDGYIEICVDGEHILAHRLARFYVTGRWPLADVDHRHCKRSDNRFDELRDATRSVNAQNLRQARSNNKSCGLLGVTWNRGKWTAQITPPGGVRTYLGRFTDPQAAHEAYLAAKRRLHEGCTL